VLSLLLMALAQAPAQERGPVAAVVVSKRPGADAYSTKVALRVFDSLKREGVATVLDSAAAEKELKAGGFSDPRTCQGGQSCVTRLAVVLGAHAVIIGVDVGKISKSLAIHLEAIAADAAEPLAAVDISVPADKWADKSIADITRFAREVKGKLSIAPPPPPPPPPDVVATHDPASDAPVRHDLTPAGHEDTGVKLAVRPAPSRVPAWGLLGGAAVAGGVSVAMAVMGFSDKARFDAALVDGGQRSLLSQQDANARAQSANTKMTVSVVTAVVAVGLAGASTYFFVRE
jgi:hypothetical protein